MPARRRRKHQRDEFGEGGQARTDLLDRDPEPPDREQSQGQDAQREAELHRAAPRRFRQPAPVAQEQVHPIAGENLAAWAQGARSTGVRRWRIRSVSRSMVATVTIIISRMALTSV